MIIQCEKCKMYCDDEFRNTICPHDTFLANDGRNNFKHYHASYLSKFPLSDNQVYEEWRKENKVKL